MTICPCQSTQTYQNCCEPFHNQTATPTTAEQLMRSRYSAFVLQNIDYIINTTVPAQQPLLDKQAISDWAKQTDWAGLQIINHIPKIGKRHAQVEFKAFFNQQLNTPNGQNFHHELSTFVKIIKADSEKWYFLDPKVTMTISQKSPCICGSGEKFKRCCGQFI